MPNSNNKNNVELVNQDFEILQAMYAEKLTLAEYALRVGIAREEAEIRLADALRRKKTQGWYGAVRRNIAEGTHHIPRQGSRFPPRLDARYQVNQPDSFLDLDDLDDWLSLE